MDSKDKPKRGAGKGPARETRSGPAGRKPARSASAGAKTAAGKGAGAPARSGTRKPAGSRPDGDRTATGAPAKPRAAFGKPAGARPASGKPAGAKPAGSRTAGTISANAGTGERSYGRPASARPDRDKRTTGTARPAAKPARSGDKPARPRPAPRAEQQAETGKPERISKILARAGIASRRDIERMIGEGRVRLNGTVLDTPVVNATLADTIEVDGMPIRGIERTRLWLYHKPAGLVTTNSDPEGRPTVFENLPAELPRVLSIGRLDINTEGLLLLTNDGGLSRVLELPTTGWLRRYRVRAHGKVDQAALDGLKDGIAVDGVLYGAIDAVLDRAQGHNVWITVALREGKNREIKNVFGALGLDVNRLIRISYGPFQLGDMPEGSVLEVHGRTLREQLGPRLIADSGANFEAPIYRDAADNKAASGDAAPERDADRGPRKPGGFEDRDDRSENRFERRPGQDRRSAEGRFSDRPRSDGKRPDGKRPDGKRSDAQRGDAKPVERGRASRGANVWMAPGARPVKGGDAAGKSSARADAERLFRKAPVPENDRPVVVNRAEEDSDWIRAESPPRRDDDGFSGRRSEGRGGRGAGDRDFGDRGPRERTARGGDRGAGRGTDGPGRDAPEGRRPARGYDDRPPGRGPGKGGPSRGGPGRAGPGRGGPGGAGRSGGPPAGRKPKK